MRYKFIHWLRKKVFHVPDCEISPKIVIILINILFPLQWLYERQTHIKWDIQRNVYYIGKCKISGEMLHHFKNSIGELFKIVETKDGVTTLERINRVGV